MIWNNIHKLFFFLISESSLADKASVIVTVSPTGCVGETESGWLEAAGHMPTVLALPAKAHLFLFQ